MSKEVLYILDISAIIFRYHFACKDAFDEDGNPNGGVYGVLLCMIRLLDIQHNTKVIWVFDGAKNNFRKEILTSYKSNRAKTDLSIINQILKIRRYGEELMIPCLSHDNYEADDIIATLCSIYEGKYVICLLANDKDLYQLVKEDVFLWNFAKKKKIDHEEVVNLLGVTPSQIVHYLSLLGDSSDCIEGIPKIGKVTAQKLLNKYDCIKNLLSTESYKYDFSNFERNISLIQLCYSVPISVPENFTTTKIQFMSLFTKLDSILAQKLYYY